MEEDSVTNSAIYSHSDEVIFTGARQDTAGLSWIHSLITFAIPPRSGQCNAVAQ
jgi:hypothetical protein